MMLQPETSSDSPALRDLRRYVAHQPIPFAPPVYERAGATVGLLLPWGRAQESEADYLGMIYMAKAGYHPAAARDLWVRMGEASSGQRQPEFLSTHPSPETRIKQLEGRQPEALTHYRPR